MATAHPFKGSLLTSWKIRKFRTTSVEPVRRLQAIVGVAGSEAAARIEELVNERIQIRGQLML